MTRREYEKYVDDIIRKMDSVDVDEVEKELENLEKYKPVRLGWYFAKTKKSYLNNHDACVAWQYTNGKIFSLYNYKNIIEYLNFCKEIAADSKNTLDTKKYQYLLQAFEGDYSFFDYLLERCLKALDYKDVVDDYRVHRELYACQEFLGYLIHQQARKIFFPNERLYGDLFWVNDLLNMKYLIQELEQEEENAFVLIESEHNGPLIDFLCADLCALGKRVFRLNKPLVCENTGINILDTVPISVDSLEEQNGIVAFTPVELVDAQGNCEDNIGYLLEYIKQHYIQGKELNVLADGWRTDDLNLRPELRNTIFRVTPYRGDIHQLNLMLSFYGDYMSYISKIYVMDCNKLLEMESSVRFSIVVPARNSAATLRYTLQTCLEQTYTGAYEIIVSDNSTGDNASVYNLCQELNDPRIVYLKTPRDLPLPKSFEYAFLHAKGEYIFGIGSDDGVLPWALETLEQVVSQYPDEEIIQWQRGFYAWPGFNGGQQHQFIIPGDYKKGEYTLFYREKMDYIVSVLREPKSMYTLPMLYINSCFKRSYMKTLLEKTGRLWDGICQDIYMGVVTAYINPKILNMRYPLTIAGMSSGSVGAHANMGQKTNEEFSKMMRDNQRDNNVGGYCTSYWERLLPQTGTDTGSLYASFLRAVSFGIIPDEYLDKVFNWKDMFMDLAQELNVRDVALDKKIHMMQYAAMKHGEEFLQWFNETIYEPVLEPRLIDEEASKAAAKKKTYQCGPTPQGGQILDASEYGVENVYDAVQLFERLTKL